MSVTNLGAMFKARRSLDPGPIWHSMVAEFGWPAEGVPWTPALHQLIAAARVDPAVVVVLEESDTQPLTLRAVPAAQPPAVAS